MYYLGPQAVSLVKRSIIHCPYLGGSTIRSLLNVEPNIIISANYDIKTAKYISHTESYFDFYVTSHSPAGVAKDLSVTDQMNQTSFANTCGRKKERWCRNF